MVTKILGKLVPDPLACQFKLVHMMPEFKEICQSWRPGPRISPVAFLLNSLG